MKVLFILEAGIPEYRNFLFERLAKEEKISEFLILHNGKSFNGSGDYNQKKTKFIGNNKFGFHLGILRYLFKFDIVISSYNLRIITCWYPMFLKNKWILWGKGMGSNENKIVKILRKITSQKATKILVYNSFKKEELVQATGVDKKKVIAYNNTISVSNSGYIDNSERDYFLYFGRIQERKGLEELLVQYKKYKDVIPKEKTKRIRFVGNGVFLDKLKIVCSQLNLEEEVDFFPGVYDDFTIKKHFENAIAYVSPYNVGLGVVNSFAYGVPVITCREKQVGPEFHYLNKDNSLVSDKIEDLYLSFINLSSYDNSNEIYRRCYRFYKENLSEDNMYDHFIETIIQTHKEE